ncbi:5-formyltetrahydrofolate cyclo-ligase [Alteribacter natronophilus]|uniref:5-formyltetrahydrofolate cyclo-ligase n=1 Tax=Alteribacter natronophilus TaxID=2583810 RepID=UPI0014868785|nr:5-formyltetrahydrofolate cyclo-ligase [Alteribacter natronophilus]
MDEKKSLRASVLSSLENSNHDDLKIKDRQIRNNLFSLSEWKKAGTVGVTISRGTEVDTKAVIEEGWRMGKTMAAPKCEPGTRSLHFYVIESYDDLEDSYYGLKEPDPGRCRKLEPGESDLCIVPGVVFSREGYRVGYGGGYYDRYLAANPGLFTCSLLYSDQLKENIPVEEHDQPVKIMITENGVV